MASSRRTTPLRTLDNHHSSKGDLVSTDTALTSLEAQLPEDSHPLSSLTITSAAARSRKSTERSDDFHTPPPRLHGIHHSAKPESLKENGAQSEVDSFHTAASFSSAGMSGGRHHKDLRETQDSPLPPSTFYQPQSQRANPSKRTFRTRSPDISEPSHKRSRSGMLPDNRPDYSMRRRSDQTRPEPGDVVDVSSDDHEEKPHPSLARSGGTATEARRSVARPANRGPLLSRPHLSSSQEKELAHRDEYADFAKGELLDRFLNDATKSVNLGGDMPPLTNEHRPEMNRPSTRPNKNTSAMSPAALPFSNPVVPKMTASSSLGSSIFDRNREKHTVPATTSIQPDHFKVPPVPSRRNNHEAPQMPFHQDSDSEDSPSVIDRTKFFNDSCIKRGASHHPLERQTHTWSNTSNRDIETERTSFPEPRLSRDGPPLSGIQRGQGSDSRSFQSAFSGAKQRPRWAAVESEADRAMRSERRMTPSTTLRMLDLAAATQADNRRKTRVPQDGSQMMTDQAAEIGLEDQTMTDVFIPLAPYRPPQGAPPAPMTMASAAQMTSAQAGPAPRRDHYEGMNLHNSMPERVGEYVGPAGSSSSSGIPQSIQQMQERNARIARELQKSQRDRLSDAGSARDDNWTSHVTEYDRKRAMEAQRHRLNQRRLDKERERIEAGLLDPQLTGQELVQGQRQSRESTPRSSFGHSQATSGPATLVQQRTRTGGQQSRKTPARGRNSHVSNVPLSAEEVAAYKIDDTDRQVVEYKSKKGFSDGDIAVLLKLPLQDIKTRVKMLDAKRAAAGQMGEAPRREVPIESMVVTDLSPGHVDQLPTPARPSPAHFEKPPTTNQTPVPFQQQDFTPIQPDPSMADLSQLQSPTVKDGVATSAQISSLSRTQLGGANKESREDREQRVVPGVEQANPALNEQNKNDQEDRKIELGLQREIEERAKEERIEAAEQERREKERKKAELKKRNSGLLKHAGQGRASKTVVRATTTGFSFPRGQDDGGYETPLSAAKSQARSKERVSNQDGSEQQESNDEKPKTPNKIQAKKTSTKGNSARASNARAATKASDTAATNQRGFATKAGKQVLDLRAFKDFVKHASLSEDEADVANAIPAEEPTPQEILGEDLLYNKYYVRRKTWTEDEEPEDDEADLVVECGEYISRVKANRAAMDDALRSTGADTDLAIDPKEGVQIDIESPRHGLSCIRIHTPKGHVKVWVERITCSKFKGALPDFESADFAAREIWVVLAETKVLGNDGQTWENVMKREPVGEMAFTDPNGANERAANTLIDRTFSSKATRIDEINAGKSAARYDLEDELERLTEEGKLFDKERENGKGQKIRLWVEEFKLAGARN